MSSRTRFAYAQARLQARHGLRAGDTDWRRLASSGDLNNYLQAAHHTPLQPWIQGLQADHSSHAIELQLRRHFRNYVDEVAAWLPTPWRTSIQWIRYLPDLPALQHLQHHEAAAWMHDDPALRDLAGVVAEKRLEILHHTGCARLAPAWQRGLRLPEAWLDQWHHLWPPVRRAGEGLTYLGHLFQRYLSQMRNTEASGDREPRALLTSGLNYAFRRYSFQPAAAAAHIGLVALDLERLRGELVQRALFEEITAVQS